MYKETLTGTTLTLGSGNMDIPTTVTLNSSEPGKLIEISTNDGIDFFAPNVDTDTSSMVVVVLNAKFSNIRVTGTAGDTLWIDS